MNRAVVVFFTLVVLLSVLTANSLAHLPIAVAIHFDPEGGPDAWAARDIYSIAILSALILLPMVLVWLMGWMPRLTGGKGQVPDNDYWFDAEHRKETQNFLLQHASWLGSMTAATIYAFHVLILKANAGTPPQLATNRVLAIVLIYGCGLAWWTAAFMRHFRRR